MLATLVSGYGDIPVPGNGEKTSMLARAIVVARRGRFAALDHGHPGWFVAHGMRSASKIGGIAADFGKPVLDAIGMHGIAGMGRARERDRLVVEAEGVGCPGFDERQRLYGLERGARIDGRFDVAQ